MQNIKYIACIDLGTTGCRTIIFSSDGEIISQAYEEYNSIFISPTWIDHDPSTWIQAFHNTFNRAFAEMPNGSFLEAIGVISQRSTFIPVDKKGTPLDNAILWQDKRANKQAEHICNKAGSEKIYKKTGLRVDPYFSLPKLLWIKENKTFIYKQIYKILTVHDFIIHYLTGEFITDWTQASRTMLFNINTFQWDEELCEMFDIPLNILPKPLPPGTVAGNIKYFLCKELGIGYDIPVVAAGGDQQAAAIGLGITKQGLLCCNTGTGSFILAHSNKPVFDKQQRVICTASALSGNWLMEASIFTTGAVYRWFRDNFGFVEKLTANELKLDTYDILNLEIKKTKPGAGGLLMLPHYAGSAAPYWNPGAKGMLFGLSLGHTRAHVLRAILEGICFEINKNIKIIEELVQEIAEIRVSGGATRSQLFNQIQADVYGKTVVKTENEESSALGCLAVTATGTELYSNVEEALLEFTDFSNCIKKVPDNKTHIFYEKLQLCHDKIYNAMKSHGVYDMLELDIHSDIK